MLWKLSVWSNAAAECYPPGFSVAYILESVLDWSNKCWKYHLVDLEPLKPLIRVKKAITQTHDNNQVRRCTLKYARYRTLSCSDIHFTWLRLFLDLFSFSFDWNRLPEADDGGREHHSLNVPLPVAACVRSHSARLPPPLPGRACAVPHGPPLQRAGRPHQAGAATGGTHTRVSSYTTF